MGKFYNRIEKTDFRRQQRNNMPEAENMLWQFLSKKQCLGYKFRRQHGIGSYSADFYCPKLKLAIELDGDSHFDEQGKKQDKIRDAFFKRAGIHVLRIGNDAIFTDLEGVIKTITETIRKREQKTPSNSPLVRGDIGRSFRNQAPPCSAAGSALISSLKTPKSLYF